MVIEPFLSGSITLSVVFVVSGNAGASAAIAGMAHRLRARAALNRPVRKRFSFFISVPLLLKKVIIGWAAKPPGLRVLHQHGVQCGALQRGNAAAPPALCRKEKREGKPGRLPTWLKVHLKTKEITDISQPQAGCKAKSHRNPFRIPRLFKP